MMAIKEGRQAKMIRSLAKGCGTMLAAALFSFLLCPAAQANNLTLRNLNMKSVDTANKSMTFTFDLSQDNSWRTTTNFDAAWVFMKYSTDGGQTWHHATMAGAGTNPNGFSAPDKFEIVVPPDQKGFFLERTSFGTGTITATGVQFKWDYGQDGLSDTTAQAANTLNKIFGIEMVYIPQGAFYAGDGNSSSDFRFKQGIIDNSPWYITSENAITTTNSNSGGYYYQGSGATGENANGDIFMIPNSFPKGYQAFYMMKYELTEGQWVGFFNTLTPAAKAHRDITSAVQGGKNSSGVVNRNTVSWDSTHPTLPATTLRPSRPMTYLSWPDVAAYAAWAALRPMTELEFEKAARGKDISAVADEFTWGTTTNNSPGPADIYPSAMDENGTEALVDGTMNLNRNNVPWTSGDGRPSGIAAGQAGPLRAGIFAEGGSNRVTSGAGYYGNMELSGNLSEIVVTVGRPQGRTFLGTEGSGELGTVAGYEGNATNADWPGVSTVNASYGVTGTIGTGYRGGDFQSPSLRYYQTSCRILAAKDPDTAGFAQRFDPSFGVFSGGRLVRTAP